MIVLEMPERTYTAEELLPLLTHYQMMPQLLRNLVLEQAIESVTYTPEEYSEFCQQLNSPQQNVNQPQFEQWASRQLKVRKFQQEQWGRKIKSYFLQRKRDLDQVVCSLIHVPDMELASELYFRLLDEEQTFSELAYEFSQGPEAQTGGIVGPIAISSLHPELGQRLYTSQPGQVCQPMQINGWVVIAQLETLLPVQLDAAMEQFLLNELMEAWLKEQVDRLLEKNLFVAA